jgi:hypothetical protein
VNKKRKEIERNLEQLYNNYKFIEQDKISYLKMKNKENEINDLQKQYDNLNNYLQSGVNTVLNLLQNEKFIEKDKEKEDIQLTLIGKIACQIKEIPCLIFAQLLEEKNVENLSSFQLVSLFSCFTNINVQDDLKSNFPKSEDKSLQELVLKINELYKISQDKEVINNINTGTDYNIHFDLLNYTNEWCKAESVEECKLLLQKISQEKEIFLGEFVKSLLKINNIACEMEKIAEMTGNIAFLSKLKEIPNITLKYVVTNQSLYV